MNKYIIEVTNKELRFINAYMEAIYFTDTEDIGLPDSDATLDETFERESIIDCLAFFQRIECYLSDEQIPQAGHDFWLTRNRHGTGFWDRVSVYNYECYGKMFTDIAHSFGEVSACFNELTIEGTNENK